MQINWSLVLNSLLLLGVLVTIRYLIKARRQCINLVSRPQPSLGLFENKGCDEIIAVRQVKSELLNEKNTASLPSLKQSGNKPPKDHADNKTIMIFLLAKENRQFAGYELLQTLLSCGLRFGTDQLFHRHQHPNGKGPVLCSLAVATKSGVFDLQNMGAFSARGLCLFMDASSNPTIDAERLNIMHETAKQLAEGLDAYLLDDYRKPFTEASFVRYSRRLNIPQQEQVS